MNWSKIAFLLFLLFAAGPAANSQTVSEEDSKFVLLINFANRTKWPDTKFATPSSPLIVGVLDDDPFYDTLKSNSKGGTVQDRPLQIKRFSNAEEARSAHILWISSSKKEVLDSILLTLSGSAVLTMSDVEGFVDAGGMIEWFLKDKRTRFRVNNTAAKQENLLINSYVLKLADSMK